MIYTISPALTAKAGTLQVIAVVRHSDGPNQTELSLQAQERAIKELLDANWKGPLQIKLISSTGSGERLDRKELRELEDLVETRQFDLVIAEESSRIVRNIKLHEICGHCLDHETRLIAANDNIDTARPDWENSALFSGLRAGSENEFTSKRIRGRMDEHFLSNGMIGSTPRWFNKPKDSTSDKHCKWDPDAVPVIMELVSRMETNGNASAAADWLNTDGVDPWDIHPERESDKRRQNRPWDAGTVLQFVRNPLLSGRRVRGLKRSKKHHGSGRRFSAKNKEPNDIRWRDVPHLKLIEPDRHQALLDKLAVQNANRRRKGEGAGDPRTGVPRKRTVWPGQAMECSICGRPFHYGANGSKTALGCRGYQDYKCWNAAVAMGPESRKQLLNAVSRAIEALPDWPEDVRNNLVALAGAQQENRSAAAAKLEKAIREAGAEITNYTRAVGRGVNTDSIVDALREAEIRLKDLRAELRQLQSRPVLTAELPSMEEIRQMARDAIASAKPEEGMDAVLRKLIGKIIVRPVRTLWRPMVWGVGEFTLDLTSLVPTTMGAEELTGALRVPMKVELFDRPQPAAHAIEVGRLRAEGMFFRAIGKQLGITFPAAMNADKLFTAMSEAGVTLPYVEVKEPAELPGKRRFKHKRYKFVHKNEEIGTEKQAEAA